MNSRILATLILTLFCYPLHAEEMVISETTEGFSEAAWKKSGKIDEAHGYSLRSGTKVNRIGERTIGATKYAVVKTLIAGEERIVLVKVKSLSTPKASGPATAPNPASPQLPKPEAQKAPPEKEENKNTKSNNKTEIGAPAPTDAMPPTSQSEAGAENHTPKVLTPYTNAYVFTEPGWNRKRVSMYESNPEIQKSVAASGEPVGKIYDKIESGTPLTVVETKVVNEEVYHKVEFSCYIGILTCTGWIPDVDLQEFSSCCNPEDAAQKALNQLKNLVATLNASVPQEEPAPIDPTTPLKDYKSPPLPEEFGGACNGYIKPDGNYGAKGLHLREQILGTHSQKPGNSENFFEAYMNPPLKDIPTLCPKFSKFDNETKINFWIWIFSSLAFYESTCRSDSVNLGGTNTAAIGDFQIEDPWEFREIRGQGCDLREPAVPAFVYYYDRKAKKVSKRPYFKGSSRGANYKNNIACAVQMMGNYITHTGAVAASKRFSRPTKLFGYKSNYWERIKHNDSELQGVIKKFPKCR